jgi:hypothetical protein
VVRDQTTPSASCAGIAVKLLRRLRTLVCVPRIHLFREMDCRVWQLRSSASQLCPAMTTKELATIEGITRCEFESRHRHQTRALSSEAEQGSYKAQVGISKFSARTTSMSLSSAVEQTPDKREIAGQHREGQPLRTTANEKEQPDEPRWQTGSSDPERKADWIGAGLLTRSYQVRILRGSWTPSLMGRAAGS